MTTRSPAPANLIARLLQVARYLENEAAHRPHADERGELARLAQTCRAAALRLEALELLRTNPLPTR